MSVAITIDVTGETLTFDGYDAITWSPRVILPSHDIEEGSPTTDHAKREPDVFTVRAARATPVQRFVAKPNAVEDAKTFLDRCVGELLTVDTVRDGRIRNCMLEGWSHTQGRRVARDFDLSFRVVRIATPVTVTIPARQPSAAAGSGMADEVDAGKQATSDVGSQTEQSSAAALADLLFGGS